MMDNAARQMMPEETAPQLAPTPKAQPTPVSVPAALPQRIAWSPLERLLSVACGLAVVAFCLLFLTAQNTLANTNRHYQDLQAQIATQNSHVDDYKQTIGELTNSDRLSNFAKAHGFAVIEGNIKRVTNK